MDTFTLTFTHTKSFQASGAAKRLARATPTIAKFIAIKWSRGLRVMATNRTRKKRRSKKTLTTQQDKNRTKPNFLPTIWNEKRAVTHSKMS